MAKAKAPARKKSQVREVFDVVLWALVMAFLARSFLIQAFQIPSGSMEDTLLIGDFLFVNKFLYGPKIPFTDIRLPGLREPRPGDIIVFKNPREGEDFIKRCVAVGGQTLELKNNVLYVDGEKRDEPYLKLDRGSAQKSWGPYTVPEGKIFMMGDNRNNSSDSRVFGPVDWRETVKGKAIFIYWSWDKNRNFPRFSRIGDLIH